MPAWLPYIALALVVVTFVAWRQRRRSARRASPADRALADVVQRTAEPADAPTRATPLDAEKRESRRTDGARVRLRGAVVDGTLDRTALQTILVERRNIGEQAKAVRVLLQFFPLPEAVPVLLRALHAHGDDFLPLARFAFGQCGMPREIDRVVAEVDAADEPWLLGALLFADPFSQRPLCAALARVGGRRTIEALGAMGRGGRPTPWVREAIAAVRARLKTEHAGGLTVARPDPAAGGLSAARPDPSERPPQE